MFNHLTTFFIKLVYEFSGLASGASGPGNTYFQGINTRDTNPDQVRNMLLLAIINMNL
jgi:hypothetical protein